MTEFKRHSLSEQVAHHLKELLAKGRWVDFMPGTPALEAILGVDRKTISSAIRILIKEGWLEDQGLGKKRKILDRIEGQKLFRVGFLGYDDDGDLRLVRDLFEKFSTRNGILMEVTPDSMSGLNWDVSRIADMVRSMDMDAWIVPGGSIEVLEWFEASGMPVYAVFGRHQQFEIDGFSFNFEKALIALADRLLDLGHQRISLVTRRERRKPTLGAFEEFLFECLSPAGIRPDSISLPDWEETPEGFHDLLESLFRFTPPTALILPEPFFVHSAIQFFATKGIKVPKDVSVVSSEDCMDFHWTLPKVARFNPDRGKAGEMAAEWVEKVRKGFPAPKKKTSYPVEFIDGGTLATPGRR